MEKFNKTLSLLNRLIQKLEANTGGEVKQEIKISQPETKQTTTVIQPVNVEKKQQTKPVKTKDVENKKEKKEKPQKVEKKEQKKEQKKEEEPANTEMTTTQDKKQKKAQKVEKGQKKAEKADKKEQKKQDKGQNQTEQKKEDAEATIEDFAMIDIRIGQIVECWKHPESEKLYCEKIKVCGEVREIASGLQQFVPIDEMVGPVIVMANLKPRPLAKFMSNGMVVCASNHDHTDVKIIRPVGENSERVFLQGHQNLFKTAALLPVLNPKKKILEKCLEHFRTDGEGFVTWKGIKARTSGGYLKAVILDGHVS